MRAAPTPRCCGAISAPTTSLRASPSTRPRCRCPPAAAAVADQADHPRLRLAARRWPNPSMRVSMAGCASAGLHQGAIQGSLVGSYVFRHALRPLSGDGTTGASIEVPRRAGSTSFLPRVGTAGYMKTPDPESVHRHDATCPSRACLYAGDPAQPGLRLAARRRLWRSLRSDHRFGSAGMGQFQTTRWSLITTAARERRRWRAKRWNSCAASIARRCWPTCAASAIHRPMPKTSPAFFALHRTRLVPRRRSGPRAFPAACC